MSAKDAVKAREQSKRRPVTMPIEQSIHKRKPTVTVNVTVSHSDVKQSEFKRRFEPPPVDTPVEPEPSSDKADAPESEDES